SDPCEVLLVVPGGVESHSYSHRSSRQRRTRGIGSQCNPRTPIHAANRNRVVGAASRAPRTTVCCPGAPTTPFVSYRRQALGQAGGTSRRKGTRPSQAQR